MMFIQIILGLFLLFAVSRVVSQLRGGNISIVSFFFWTGFFIAALIGLLFPELTSKIAAAIGIGRGADLVFYVSIAILFYLVFRIHMLIEDLRHEISEIIRQIALKDLDRQKKK